MALTQPGFARKWSGPGFEARRMVVHPVGFDPAARLSESGFTTRIRIVALSITGFAGLGTDFRRAACNAAEGGVDPGPLSGANFAATAEMTLLHLAKPNPAL